MKIIKSLLENNKPVKVNKHKCCVFYCYEILKQLNKMKNMNNLHCRNSMTTIIIDHN